MENVFYNQPGRVARMMSILAVPLIALGVPSLIVLIRYPHRGNTPFSTVQGWALGGTIALPIAGGMLLTALLTLPAAMRARRIFAEFQSGNYLARWKYDDAYWQTYIDGESRRLRTLSRGAFVWVCIGGAIVLTMMAVGMNESPRAKFLVVLAIITVTLVIAFFFYSVVRAYAKSRRERLMRCGEAIIARHAAYMGGDLAFWGYGMRALKGARFVPGDPPMIELVVGLNDFARKAMRIVDLVSDIALKPSYNAGMSQTQLVPVPSGDEASARALVKTLGELMPQAVHTPTASAPINAAPGTRATGVAIQKRRISAPVSWETTRRRARRWWHITAALAAIGVSLFFVAVMADMNLPKNHPPNISDSLAVWGFVIFILSFLTLPVALLKTLNIWRRHRHLLPDVSHVAQPAE